MLASGVSGDFYADDGNGGFDSAPGTFASLVAVGGGYELTDQDNNLYVFDGEGYVLSKTDPQGRITTYHYVTIDDKKRISSVVEPFLTTNFTYSGGRLVGSTNTGGMSVGFGYSGGLLTTVTRTDPDGPGPLPSPVTTYTYDGNNRVTSRTGPDGKVTAWTYDATGRVESVESSDGSATDYVSPFLSAVNGEDFTETITTSDSSTSYTYDRYRNVIREVDALGNEVNYERDINGLLLAKILPDPDGEGPQEAPVYEYTYDERGNKLTETLPDQSVRTWVYHETWNKPIKYTDANGHITLYEYDSTHELLLSETKVIGEIDDLINLETDDLTTTYTYTPVPSGPTDPPQGLVASEIAPDGVVTQYEYDENGRRTKTTYAGGTVDEAFTTRTYDSEGKVLTETDEMGNTTTYTYDDLGRQSTITAPDPDGAGPLSATVTTYTYNAQGLKATESVNGRTTTYTYDSKGRLIGIEQEDPDGAGPLIAPETTYTYDADGRRLTTTDSLGNVTTNGFTDGRLTSVTRPDPDGAGPQSAPVISYTYDAMGRILTQTDALGGVTTFSYDHLGREVSVTLPDPDGAGPLPALSSLTTYDLQGRIVSQTDFQGITTTYTYDFEGNVLTETTPHGTTTYEYDELNRLVKSETADPDGDGPLTGLVTTYVYTAAGQVAAVTTPKGTTSYTYDNRRRRTSVTSPDPDGAGPQAAPVVSNTYDAAGNVLTETDALGNVTSYQYDALSRVVEITAADPDGPGALTSPVTEYVYDEFGQLVNITDPNGGVTTYQYDNLGRQTKVIYADPDGVGPLSSPEVTYAYDAAGQLTSMTDELGNVTTYEYDNLGRQISVTLPDPDGAGAATSPVYSYVYDANGQLLSETDALDRTTSYTYDAMGRKLTETLPDPDGAGPLASPETTYAYDANGRLQSITESDPDGAGPEEAPFTSFAYDARGEMVAETTLAGTTFYVYDNLGRLVQVTEPDPDGPGNVQASQTTYFFDQKGDMVAVYDGYRAPWQNVNPLDVADDGGIGGSLVDFAAFVQDYGRSLDGPFDPNHAGRYADIDGDGDVDSADHALFVAGFGYTSDFPTEMTIAGHLTQYEYDNLSRVTKKTDAEGGETTYTYDGNGNRLTLTDPVLNTTYWTYDGLGRVLTETNELIDTRTFGYDAAGNLIEKTDRNGRITQYEYDYLHRRTAEKWMDGVTVLRTFSYGYDAASQLVFASDPEATYTFSYDNLGRNTSTEHSLASLGFDIVIDEAYDQLGRRISLAAEINGTADLVNTYTYDIYDRMTQVTQAGQTGGNAVAEKRVDFAYDPDDKGRFTSITRYADLGGTHLVATSSYGYDLADNLISLTHADSSSTTLAGYTWRYDSAYRLTQFTVAGYPEEDVIYTHDGTDNDESYTYDANGNRTNAGYVTGDNNRLLSDGTYNYTYDEEGNRLTKANIATGEVFEYEWDYRNQLVSIVTKDSLGVVTHSVDYVYDIFARRIGKVIDADGAGSGTATEEIYIYDGLREERGNAGDHILLAFDENDALTTRLLYGTNVDQVLAQEDVDSLFDEGETLWALTDHQGSVRDIVTYDVIANTATVENHIVYDAFGQITAESDPSVVLLVAFTGRERDLESDLQYNRFRYYDAAIGRWANEDPLGFNAGDTNLARYIGNWTVDATDPSGLWIKTTNNQWIADNEEDTFLSLLDLVDPERKLRAENVMGIIPVVTGDAELDEEIKVAYDKNIGIDAKPVRCGLYDTASIVKGSLRTKDVGFGVGRDIVTPWFRNDYIEHAARFYGIAVADRHLTGDGVNAKLKSVSGEGSTPISSLLVVGHSSRNSNKIGAMDGSQTFEIENPAAIFRWSSYDNAIQRKLSPGFWFAVDAEVRLAGCTTAAFANTFSTVVLRSSDAIAHGTTMRTWAETSERTNGLPAMGWTRNGRQPITTGSLKLTNSEAVYHAARKWTEFNGPNR